MNSNTLAASGMKQKLLTGWRSFRDLLAAVFLAALAHGRDLGRRTALFAAAAVKTLRGVRLVVNDREFSMTLDCLHQFEAQALGIALHLGSPEKKLRACLDIARTTRAFGRDTGPVLAAGLQILQDRNYWIRKQNRVFTAAQMACSMARLAADSDQPALGNDIYLWAQQYNALIVDVDRRIALAVALSDVADQLSAGCDQATWLTVAMELASGIKGEKPRLGAVNFVAHKMVSVGIPPATNTKEDRRFTVVEEPTLGLHESGPSEKSAAAAAVAASAGDDEIDFDILPS